MNDWAYDCLIGLLFFGGVMALLIGLVMVGRQQLLTRGFTSRVILRLWLAIPLGLLSAGLATLLVSHEMVLVPISFEAAAATSEVLSIVVETPWFAMILGLWLVVAWVRLIKLIGQYARFKRHIMRHSNPVGVQLLHTELDCSPMAIGLFKPVVVLPHNKLSVWTEEEQAWIRLHEQVHCQRLDPLWRFVWQIFCCLYWFVPGQKRVKAALIHDQEMSCDERVIELSQQPAGYAQLLLKMNLQMTAGPSVDSAMVCSAAYLLKERIMKIGQTKHQRNHRLITALFLLAVMVVSGASALPEMAHNSSHDMQLTAVKIVNPQYPRKAYLDKTTGSVKLRFIVNTKGHFEDIEVVESSPGDLFVKEAIRAVEQWTFEPVIKPVQSEQVIQFHMD